MKIRELLQEADEHKKKPSALPTAASLDDMDDVDGDIEDSEEEDEPEDDVNLGDLTNYAGDAGDDLWTVSSLKYDGLGTAKNDKSVISQLNSTAKDLHELKHAINILKTANGRNGAVTSIIVNGLTGSAAVFHVEAGTEPRIMPESFFDDLENHQAVKMNKIIDAGSRYSKALTNFLDNTDNYDAHNAAESRQDRLLWALNYEDQKFPVVSSNYDKMMGDWRSKRKAELQAKRAQQG